ncbi:ShlB/FhaC/HecB family hemolysin secretion/activation protein [Rickettsiella endosymbiont of Dermanyssus gallinae]|uniref:ShlB/FhaC/HecB family hemolysin secretion/activation protein n=1 Tax=Rickettsiella endosymbiont of Dermanyssus gallinae TaxID=2856608 RepID=UPI001C532383|nr:ShlB/FhaC/HecB family hemolysin secretion/activation protein [Rickettsiella endosymbiont of Dermanyssus gallinae]
MKGKHTTPYYKFSLLLIKLAVCYYVFLPYAQAAQPLRAPQGSQLLPQNPRELVPTFPSNTQLQVEQPKSAENISTATLYVSKIKIFGNTVFDPYTLHALVADGEKKTQNLNQLNKLAARISHYYQQHGYPFSRAYIPAQTIKNGVVQFNILEARSSAIQIKNSSRLSPYKANQFLSPLHINNIIQTSKLNRSLLLLNDLSGIVTRSTIGPGKTVGSSDLEVLIEPGNSINGFVGIDNYGSPYTGRTRYSGSLQFNNPTGQGDQIVIDGLSSGRNLLYGHFGYDFPLYPAFNIGTNYYGMTYRLQDNLDPLHAEGNLNIADLWLSYDWVRRVHVNFNSILRYVYKNMHDNLKAVDIYKMRHSNSFKLENTAEFRDPYGTTNVYMALTQGILTFNNAFDGGGIDSISARTAGSFTKANLHLSRLQQFTENTSLYVGGDVQLASKNLDSSEQLVLGGPFIVRSYDVGTISGAQGYTATAELRHILNMPTIPGTWRPLIFIDAGRIQINKDQFINDSNLFNLYSTGVGLDVSWKDWNLSGRFAHRIGAPPPPNIVSLIDDNQVWVQFGKNF